MSTQKRILVTGAGGFIGHHLVKRLKRDGHWVRGVDLKFPDFESTEADEFEILDLRVEANARRATKRIDQIFNLGADMGGIGYITASHAEISRNNILINANMLEGARINGVGKFLFSSSVCVYPQYKQKNSEVAPLKEEDAIPSDPEPGYGWEKLFAEQLCKYYSQDYKLEMSIVRFHNVYGPLGTYDGGKEKSPAALCRKIALAKSGDEVELWGDGDQTRSYMFIDDCVEGLIRLMASKHREPLNLGTDYLVSINQLFDLIASISGKKLRKVHDLSKPQGVRGRNSDNSLLRNVLGWEPKTPLKEGLAVTYGWIEAQVRAKQKSKEVVAAIAVSAS